MDQHTLSVLEFHKVLEIISDMALSDPGRKECRLLTPVDQVEKAQMLQQESAEMISLRAVSGDLPLGGLRDILPALNVSRTQGSRLSGQELLGILNTLDAMHGTGPRLIDGEGEYPRLHSMGRALIPLPHLETAIRRSIGPRGEILDTASPDLARIRSKIVQVRGAIRQKLESILYNEQYQSALQDRIITIRNDRFVIPIRADNRTAIPCIVHDQSQSRATLFSEPLSVVDSNNELSLLHREEREEEERVLAGLTRLIGQDADVLQENYSLICRIDVLHAIARWAESMNCSTPVSDETDVVEIRSGRHPLLVHQFRLQGREERVVPVDIRFGGEQRTLIISGANAGGKTVALKTLGLMALMAQSGIPIPANERSRLPVFRHIMADIGDDQNIEQNLSTFSAHVRRLVEICRVADSNSLVLLDEIGVGTDPEEGAALALSTLDYFRDGKVYAAATTHLNAVKTYAYQHSEVVNVSVAFDQQNLQPLYSLIYGVPGLSNAMLIMTDLGVPEPILTGAEKYRSEDQQVAARLIKDFQEIHRAMTINLQELRDMRARAGHVLSRLEEILSQMRRRRDDLLTDFQREARDIVRRGRVAIRHIVKELNKSPVGEMGRHWKELEGIREEMQSALKSPPPDLRPLSGPPVKGQVVAVRSLGGMDGTVTRIDARESAVEVRVGSMKIHTHHEDLAAPSHGASRRKKSRHRREADLSTQTESLRPWNELNIIGMSVEEALPMVDKHIDSAILSGAEQIRIVHGHGTGRLRKAVQEHLRTHRCVAAMGSGPPQEGGNAVTVVRLKD